jgi:hypothetical protein
VNRDLGSAVHLTSQATVSVQSDGEGGNHPLPTSIQPNAWATVSSLTSTSVPPLTTSVDLNAVSATLFSDLPSSSLEPTPQAVSVDGSSSSESESTAQATLEARFQGEAHVGRRWKTRDHRSGTIHIRRMGKKGDWIKLWMLSIPPGRLGPFLSVLEPYIYSCCRIYFL